MTQVNSATSNPVAAQTPPATSTSEAASKLEQARLVTDLKQVESDIAHIARALVKADKVGVDLAALITDIESGRISGEELFIRANDLQSRKEADLKAIFAGAVHVGRSSHLPQQGDRAPAAMASQESPSTAQKSEEAPPAATAPQ